MERPTEVSHELEEAWLERNKNQLISCPLQPGSLRISQKACLKRHILGGRAKMHKFRDWAEIQRIGLARCKDVQSERD